MIRGGHTIKKSCIMSGELPFLGEGVDSEIDDDYNKLLAIGPVSIIVTRVVTRIVKIMATMMMVIVMAIKLVALMKAVKVTGTTTVRLWISQSTPPQRH